jgi:S1-C subfamily serine protease
VNDEPAESQPTDPTPAAASGPATGDVPPAPAPAASPWSAPATEPAPAAAEPQPPAPTDPFVAPAATEPVPAPTQPVSPWAPPAPAATDPVGVPAGPAYVPAAAAASVPPSGAGLPPVPPQTPPPGPTPASGGDGAGRTRSVGWRQFVVGAVVGALVGGGTAAGVAVATRNDTTNTTRTVVVGDTASKPVRNTSVIGKAKDVQDVLAKVNGAVVAIQVGAAVDSGLFSGNSNSNSTGAEGTGFVISPDGVIVTNNHVVADAGGRIEVEFADGTKDAATLLGRAPEYDLAVIKVDGKNLPTVKLGSSDSLQVGDEVVAVGNALALQGGLSVTEGIISGKGRVVPEEETGATLYDMLQTDAAINPGNSGGPLLDAAGEVVGINTALAGDSQNVGFAISIDSAKAVINALKDGKSVRVAFLGVETSDVTPAIAKSLNLTTKNGAVVRKVTSGAAADKGGVKENDVIIAIGGRTVTSPEDVGAEIRRYSPGDTVDVTVERGGQDTTLHVDLGVRPDSVG